jgi:hypothetical protein
VALGDAAAQRVHVRPVDVARQQRRLARRPGGEPGGQVDPAAVDQRQRRHHAGVLGGEPHGHVAAPGLPGHHHPVEPQADGDRREVGGRGGRVVAVGRALRPAVAAQVHRVRRVALAGERGGDLVPQPGVRGQAVHQENRRPVGETRTGPAANVERDIVGDSEG